MYLTKLIACEFLFFLNAGEKMSEVLCLSFAE